MKDLSAHHDVSDTMQHQTTINLKKRKLELDKICHTMSQALIRDMKQLSTEHQVELNNSIEYIRHQITYKFEQLTILVNKSDNTQKEDKLSRMIQAVVAGL